MAKLSKAKNVMKYARKVVMPLIVGEKVLEEGRDKGKIVDDLVEFEFSADRQDVNQIRLLVGNTDDEAKVMREVHNFLYDTCKEDQREKLVDFFNDNDNMTLQMELFQKIMPLLGKNKTGLGEPRIAN